jgi:hypothetical protein
MSANNPQHCGLFFLLTTENDKICFGTALAIIDA